MVNGTKLIFSRKRNGSPVIYIPSILPFLGNLGISIIIDSLWDGGGMIPLSQLCFHDS